MKLRMCLPLAALAATFVFGAGIAPASGPGARASATGVNVNLKEMKILLSTSSVRRGTVRFSVANVGKVPHDFSINGHKTRLLRSGQRATLTVTFARKGRYAYVCTVPGHAAAGMHGSLTVT